MLMNINDEGEMEMLNMNIRLLNDTKCSSWARINNKFIMKIKILL